MGERPSHCSSHAQTETQNKILMVKEQTSLTPDIPAEIFSIGSSGPLPARLPSQFFIL